jgi:hypothetical protein
MPTISIFQTSIFFVLMVSSIFSSKGNAQCADPIVYEDFPFNFDLEQINPSQLIFEGFECNPCQFETLAGPYDPDWVSTCRCHTYWDNQYDSLYQVCMDECKENFGGFEYNYGLLHQCEQECPDEVNQYIAGQKNNCGDIPEPNEIDTYFLTVLFWYTTDLIEMGTGAPDDNYASNSFTEGNYPPKQIRFTTEENLHNQNISYCIEYELRINNTDGTCCYFYGRKCVQQ